MTTGTLNAAVLASLSRPEYNTARSISWHRADRRVTTSYDFLKGMTLFAGITDAELEALARDFTPHRFQHGEVIFHQGDPGQMLYLIQSGHVRIFVMGEEGQETSVTLCGPGDIFGELAVIDGLPRSASAAALEDTVVLTLSRDRLREHMRRAPQLALNFMRALSVRLRSSTQQVETLTFLGVPGRLARQLLGLARDYGVVEPDGVRIDTTLTQSDLASLIGATRESINKAMGSLRRQGLVITRGNSIVIVDPDALREMGS